MCIDIKELNSLCACKIKDLYQEGIENASYDSKCSLIITMIQYCYTSVGKTIPDASTLHLMRSTQTEVLVEFGKSEERVKMMRSMFEVGMDILRGLSLLPNVSDRVKLLSEDSEFLSLCDDIVT